MFTSGDAVTITGGSWRGHRAMVAATPEQAEPSAVLVTVERPGVRSGICTDPIPMYHQYWIAPQYLRVRRRAGGSDDA